MLAAAGADLLGVASSTQLAPSAMAAGIGVISPNLSLNPNINPNLNNSTAIDFSALANRIAPAISQLGSSTYSSTQGRLDHESGLLVLDLSDPARLRASSGLPANPGPGGTTFILN